MVARVRQHPATCQLGVGPPALLRSILVCQPGLGKSGRDHSKRPDCSPLQVATRFSQARAKPVLVSDGDFERMSPSQAHDVGGFLDIGR